MNKIKKLLALFIASTMIMSTFAMGAFAEDTYKIPTSEATAGDLAIDATITITGLAAGDTVNLYRVIEWEEGTGWILSAGFTGLDSTSQTIANILANQANQSLTKEDAEQIALLAKATSGGPTAVDVKVIDGDTYTYTSNTKPGMYIALVQPADANTLYNPIIISADFTTDNDTNQIDSSETMGTSAVAKKSVVDTQKQSEDTETTGNTHDIGDTVPFTVTTTIPAYSQSYDKSKLHFEITDTLSTGLELQQDVAVVTSETVGSTVTYNGTSGFTVTFDPDDIWDIQVPVDVTITYTAKITGDAPANINEETNTIEINFSNDPKDDNGHGHLKDVTKHYSFTLDGELFGDKNYTTTELVKTGVDSEGKVVTSEHTYDNGSTHGALEGAVFGVYSDPDEASAESANYYTNDAFSGTVSTNDEGKLFINGLDEGTYYLKELTAPAGYIKDQKVYTITIEVTAWSTNTYTETLSDGCEVEYDVKTADSYTVTITDGENGSVTSSYEMTLSGPTINTVAASDDTTELINTKGVELPATGGMGTTIFYIIGSILVVGAGIILVARRRMSLR